MKKILKLVSLGIVIFLLSFISADFEIGDSEYEIQNNYASGGIISGWINLSLDNEDSDILFETNSDESIKLIDLINGNSLEYTCESDNCEELYSAVNAESVKVLNLGIEERMIGFFIEGENVNEIDSLSIVIRSLAEESCSNQINVEFFGGMFNLSNKDSSGNFCDDEDYSCYDDDEDLTDLNIVGDGTYCQNFSMSESPGIKVGADLTGDGEVNFIVYDSEEYSIGNCEALVGTNQCNIDEAITEGNYYVCVERASGSPKISGYEIGASGCGRYEEIGIDISEPFEYAYSIFTHSKKYKTPGTLEKTSEEKDELLEYINDYLESEYNNDCSDGCIFPIKIISNIEQEVTIKEIGLGYSYEGGSVDPIKNIYDLEGNVFEMSMNFSKVNLDFAKFKAPLEMGDFDFELSLDGDEIIDENLDVIQMPEIISVYPTMVPAGLETNFKVKIGGLGDNESISKYEWSFDDGDYISSMENNVLYTIELIGSHNLSVRITDSLGRVFSGEASLDVVSPKEAVGENLNKTIKNFNSLKSQIESFPAIVKSSLESIFDLDSFDTKLKDALAKYNTADLSDEESIVIMGVLNEIDIPEAIHKTRSIKGVPFYTERQNIDLDFLKDISGVSYNTNSSGGYKDAIVYWGQNDISVKIDFSEYSAIYDDKYVSLLSSFDVSISSPESLGKYYVGLMGLAEIQSVPVAEVLDLSSHYSFTGDETFSFTTNSVSDVKNLPIVISPVFSKLNIQSSSSEGLSKMSKILILVLAIFLLLLIAFSVYIFLQLWYKNKYENYLFKDKNNLYNLVNYIKSSKGKGEDDKKIIRNLKKIGWTGEQISYVMKKYIGKRTGMVELPGSKFFDKKNKNLPLSSNKNIGRKRFNGSHKYL